MKSNKFKKWLNKPWTNGSYLKLCGISVLIGLVEVGYMFRWDRAIMETAKDLIKKEK